MPIIKLDAIDSTNDYLKKLARENQLEDFTLVIANKQTNGKGQMGAKWVVEEGKNLTMSILVKNVVIEEQTVFDFNVAVTLALFEALSLLQIPKLKIKWPNDIMADSKKVGGILIENSLKSDGSFTSVVGIGLNLNQTNFEHLPKASSLYCITNKIYDIEETAVLISECLQKKLGLLRDNSNALWDQYHDVLFKRGEPVAFEDFHGSRFMGIIQQVNREGRLAVKLEDDSVNWYGIKEIQLLY